MMVEPNSPSYGLKKPFCVCKVVISHHKSPRINGFLTRNTIKEIISRSKRYVKMCFAVLQIKLVKLTPFI